MTLVMEIQTECNHLFVLQIASLLEAPQVGASISCQKCKKKTTVRHAGIAHKDQREEEVTEDKNQKSILDKE